MDTENPTETKALQVPEPPPIRPEEPTGRGRCWRTGCYPWTFLRQRVDEALLHGPEQIADLPVPVVESPGAVRIGHPERGHLVEYLAPNSVFKLVASPTFVSASRAR